MNDNMNASTNFYAMSESGMVDLEGTNPEAHFSSQGNQINHQTTTQDHTTGSETMHLPEDGTFFDSQPTNMEDMVHRVSDVSSQGHPMTPHKNDTPKTGTEAKKLQDESRNTTSSFLGRQSADSNRIVSQPQAFGGRQKTHQTNDDQTKTKGSEVEESTEPASKESGEESEFDVIARDTAMTLDKNLDSARAWTKKLLREITMYVKTLEMVQAEYLRVQGLEHKESARLDQVEPDVQGATSTLLGNQYLGESQGRLGSSYGQGGKNGSGSKRKLNHP
jgi:hypothetical protein